jgi:HEPN domain-containing protein
MNDPEEHLRWEEVEGWLTAARLDRNAALACLDFEPALALPAAFHCQQAAEKLLKAFLMLAVRPFRKTHDMAELIDAVAPLFPDIGEIVSGMEDWTAWATAARYPEPSGVREPEPAVEHYGRPLRRHEGTQRG